MDPASDRTNTSASTKRGAGRAGSRVKRVLYWSQYVLFAAFMYFIVWRGVQLWQASEVPLERLNWPFLLLGMLPIFLSWTMYGWFWGHLLRVHQVAPPWLAVMCAYFCSQLGKYMPGKGMVLVIRAGMLRSYGVSIPLSVATATYETLLSMGAGLLVAICLVPIVLPGLALERVEADSALAGLIGLIGTRPYLLSGGVLVATFACLPLISWAMNVIASKVVKLPHRAETPAVVPEELLADDQQIDKAEAEIRREHILVRDLAQGLLVTIFAWFVQSLSVGVVLVALGVWPRSGWDWLLWTLAYSLATSIGFLAIFAPGGLGVREAVLMEVLRLDPAISNQQALTAAVLLRIVMFLADLLSGLGCYNFHRWFKRRRLNKSLAHQRPLNADVPKSPDASSS